MATNCARFIASRPEHRRSKTPFPKASNGPRLRAAKARPRPSATSRPDSFSPRRPWKPSRPSPRGNRYAISIELHQPEVRPKGSAVCRCRRSAAGSPTDGDRVPQADGRDDRPSRAGKCGRGVGAAGSSDHSILCPPCSMRNTGSEYRVPAPTRRDAREPSGPLATVYRRAGDQHT